MEVFFFLQRYFQPPFQCCRCNLQYRGAGKEEYSADIKDDSADSPVRSLNQPFLSKSGQHEAFSVNHKIMRFLSSNQKAGRAANVVGSVSLLLKGRLCQCYYNKLVHIVSLDIYDSLSANNNQLETELSRQYGSFWANIRRPSRAGT